MTCMKWNVPKIFEDMGGADDLHAKLKAAGYDVQVRAVRQWLRRDNIPSDWIARILCVVGHNAALDAKVVPLGWIGKAMTPTELEDIF